MINTPRGTYDILPEEAKKWQLLENTLRKWCKRYQIQEIRTPIFEYTDLFQRGVGETTDIVQKEMFTFSIKNKENSDKDDIKSFTLRPEGTASTVRAFINNKLYGQPQPTKLFYMGPMFRYERPQAGRNRQFSQFGIEVFGSDHPSIDAEVISFANHIFKDLGIKNVRLEINSVGCPTCRQQHKEIMMNKLAEVREELCTDCDNRFERNPLRILDCKNEACKQLTQDAPLLSDHLCSDCDEHFKSVQKYLLALEIPFHINPRLVRGLDYYTQTAFEFMEDSIGAMSTICGGGRYNGLVEQLGGQDTPGIGFAIGLERLLLALDNNKTTIEDDYGIDVYAIALGEEAHVAVLKMIDQLREHGLDCEKDFLNRSMKAQMKAANRLKAKHTIIVGEAELADNKAIIRNMETSEQQAISFDGVVNYLLGGSK
ncbi:histidine--tRNA ligase [Desulfuribacillus alkaliarsenatis]|uniref:Histidine--tRNA ligase n=1 Tax=Desulfuribacillus alkaliarsenatis TaxID=766136 RepID=A0A1E5G1Q9_9FIRM|nr:histidine--tRNA ligase [Desulfuribacillus alkaliarsenatis]OEF96378.1 histidine--tRNA ligase [Desulfuribacillus alkaliarsenatis]